MIKICHQYEIKINELNNIINENKEINDKNLPFLNTVLFGVVRVKVGIRVRVRAGVE